jgi:hypothetical protein
MHSRILSFAKTRLARQHSRICSGWPALGHVAKVGFQYAGAATAMLQGVASIEFSKRWNLVRDQGVGGSNPLSPTNLLFR